MTVDAIETDVIVVGSGAAGLATAIAAAKQGRKVVVAEKTEYLGGTTAISAGWAWVPGNRQGLAEGDSREDVETYLRNLSPDNYDAARVRAFLDGVSETLQFFEAETDVEFEYPAKAPDYQMDLPGARASGRAVIPKDVNARVLREDRLRIRPYMSSYTVFGYMPQVGPDITQFINVNRSWSAFFYVARKLARTWFDTVLFRRAVIRTNGNALITRMVKTARDLGVELLTGTAVESLHRNEEGVVDGAVLSGIGRVRARDGVVLAGGGFSGDRDFRANYFPHDPDDHVSPTIGHTGDSARMAIDVGGHIDDDVHSAGSWAPVTVFRYMDGRQRLFPHLRAFGLPGLIAVDRHGRRFANESLSYHDFGREMLRHHASEKSTFGFIIGDAKAMHTYGIGYAKPWPMPRGYFSRIGYLHKGRTLDELAAKLGIDPTGLADTIAEFNRGAVVGEDAKFGRGANWYQNFKGDMTHRPNPNLAPLDRGPYFAARVRMGDLGSFAGLGVNARSEVTTVDGEAIPGLYAVGPAAVSVFGGGYPGYGSHIGPALVFGYRVGRDIAAHSAERLRVKASSSFD